MQIYKEKDYELFIGYVPEHEAKARWKKNKISLNLLDKFCSFSRAHEDIEVMAFLMYCRKQDDWSLIIPTQYCTKASVKTVDWVKDRKKISNVGTPLGSIHTHGTMGAFQSDVDKEDEDGFEGIHITLGNVDSPVMSVHSRLIFKGYENDPDLSSFIDFPEDILHYVPEEIALGILGHNVKYPEEWDTFLKKEEEITGDVMEYKIPSIPSSYTGLPKKIKKHHKDQSYLDQLFKGKTY